ncbi:MAG: hypothetical protein AB7E49_00210 [Campylobacterales bacterium]
MSRKTNEQEEIVLDRKPFEKISNWALSNAPAILGIAVASIGGIVGFAAGIGLYAFLLFYKQGR